MKIECVEIQNYRKLKSCRIDFSEKTTVLVGANNARLTPDAERTALLYAGLSAQGDGAGGHWRHPPLHGALLRKSGAHRGGVVYPHHRPAGGGGH